MKKSFTPNIPSVIFALVASITSVWTYFIWHENNTGSKVLCISVLIVCILYIMVSPHFFIADKNGLSVYYIFFLKDYYAWEDVKRINIKLSFRVWLYEFETKEHSKKVFFMLPEFHKNFIMKRLIKKYWQGELEDDCWEKLKKKIYILKQKHNTFTPDDSEAEKAEREARKKIREIIKQYTTKAEAENKYIKAVYLYETKCGEYKSRPKQSYSYNTEIEIGKIGFSEDESVYILNELLFIRYGKQNIKVMTDETVYNEISEKLNEAIKR